MKLIEVSLIYFCFFTIIVALSNQRSNTKETNVPQYYEVDATAYIPANEYTAAMTKPVVGRTVAVSRDLTHLLGRDIYIEGLGIKRIEDLMNERWVNKIDIMVPTEKDAKIFGIQKVRFFVING